MSGKTYKSTGDLYMLFEYTKIIMHFRALERNTNTYAFLNQVLCLIHDPILFLIRVYANRKDESPLLKMSKLKMTSMIK